ncbi:MAG TPA: LysM peptidoglycan-binding domain-containing protein [Thermomicrobiales bacterium]|nr:LysM peptidoglycan-binding domain-containing protein [Thermomicrobiales bacterium]
MPRWFRRIAATLCALAAGLLTLVACASPLGTNATPDDPPVAATTVTHATPTGVPVMRIVTPTPFPAGATVQVPEGPGTSDGSENPESYIVEDGDTLYAIALRFGVEIHAIIELNGLSNPNDIQAGQELRIPPRQ